MQRIAAFSPGIQTLELFDQKNKPMNTAEPINFGFIYYNSLTPIH